MAYYRDGRTLDEVGRDINVLKERARQISAKAVRKLRHASRRSLIMRGTEWSVHIHKELEREAERLQAWERTSRKKRRP